MSPKLKQTKPTSPSLQSQSSSILKSYNDRYARGKHLIHQALDLDEKFDPNSRLNKIEKAKTILKLYLDGGEIIKAILNQNYENLPR